MRWLVVLLVLVSGCLTQEVVKEKFVCSDGWVVDSSDGCVGHERVCPDCNCPERICPPCEGEVKLDYTAKAVETTTSTVQSAGDCVSLGCPAGTQYVASKNSDKYHTCDCQWAQKTAQKNIVCYKTNGEAEADGKQPCSVCVGGLT